MENSITINDIMGYLLGVYKHVFIAVDNLTYEMCIRHIVSYPQMQRPSYKNK